VQEQLPEVMTIAEVLAEPAWRLGRSKTYEAIRTGQIPHLKIGGRYFVPRAQLIRFLSGEAEPRA
jgi:excisionase family DNA binding protein